jgi:hypothetical protein
VGLGAEVLAEERAEKTERAKAVVAAAPAAAATAPPPPPAAQTAVQNNSNANVYPSILKAAGKPSSSAETKRAALAIKKAALAKERAVSAEQKTIARMAQGRALSGSAGPKGAAEVTGKIGSRDWPSGGGLESLEEKVEELCKAYVDQTNSLMKILKNKGYISKDTPFFDIPNMSNENLEDALDKLLIDIETNPIEAELERLPSVNEIMSEFSGLVVKSDDDLEGRTLPRHSATVLNGQNKLENLPKIIRSLKGDNHKLLELRREIQKRIGPRQPPRRKPLMRTLRTLLDMF